MPQLTGNDLPLIGNKREIAGNEKQLIRFSGQKTGITE
jgi:hypothetical protein